MGQKTGTAAMISIVAAVIAFFSIFSGHPFWGFLIGMVAVITGFAGIMWAASPRVGGGFISLLGTIFGLIVLGLAVLGMIGAVIF